MKVSLLLKGPSLTVTVIVELQFGRWQELHHRPV